MAEVKKDKVLRVVVALDIVYPQYDVLIDASHQTEWKRCAHIVGISVFGMGMGHDKALSVSCKPPASVAYATTWRTKERGIGNWEDEDLKWSPNFAEAWTTVFTGMFGFMESYQLGGYTQLEIGFYDGKAMDQPVFVRHMEEHKLSFPEAMKVKYIDIASLVELVTPSSEYEPDRKVKRSITAAYAAVSPSVPISVDIDVLNAAGRSPYLAWMFGLAVTTCPPSEVPYIEENLAYNSDTASLVRIYYHIFNDPTKWVVCLAQPLKAGIFPCFGAEGLALLNKMGCFTVRDTVLMVKGHENFSDFLLAALAVDSTTMPSVLIACSDMLAALGTKFLTQ